MARYFSSRLRAARAAETTVTILLALISIGSASDKTDFEVRVCGGLLPALVVYNSSSHLVLYDCVSRNQVMQLWFADRSTFPQRPSRDPRSTWPPSFLPVSFSSRIPAFDQAAPVAYCRRRLSWALAGTITDTGPIPHTCLQSERLTARIPRLACGLPLACHSIVTSDGQVITERTVSSR